MRVPHQDSYKENLRHIESEFSGISEIIAGIRKVAAAARDFDLPQFPEPKTWIFQEIGGDAKVAMGADLVAAWIVHMSHSTRLRMELLEDAVIRSIANSELLVSATLARAHMEAAAWAAYANEELIKASDSGSWEKIEKLMPAMLYGSAVAAEKKNLPEDAVLTPLVKPSSIMNAIDALDRFYSYRSLVKRVSRREFSMPSSLITPTLASAVSVICMRQRAKATIHGRFSIRDPNRSMRPMYLWFWTRCSETCASVMGPLF